MSVREHRESDCKRNRALERITCVPAPLAGLQVFLHLRADLRADVVLEILRIHREHIGTAARRSLVRLWDPERRSDELANPDTRAVESAFDRRYADSEDLPHFGCLEALDVTQEQHFSLLGLKGLDRCVECNLDLSSERCLLWGLAGRHETLDLGVAIIFE